MSRLSAVKSVRTDVHCYNDGAFDVEDNAQIRFNLRCVNSARVTGGEFVDLVGTQAWMKRVLLENKKRLACVYLVAGETTFQNCAKTRESLGNDISFIAWIRLVECGIQIDKSSRLGIGHALLEGLGDPRIII